MHLEDEQLDDVPVFQRFDQLWRVNLVIWSRSNLNHSFNHHHHPSSSLANTQPSSRSLLARSSSSTTQAASLLASAQVQALSKNWVFDRKTCTTASASGWMMVQPLDLPLPQPPLHSRQTPQRTLPTHTRAGLIGTSQYCANHVA